MISLRSVAEHNAGSAALIRSINGERGKDPVVYWWQSLWDFHFVLPLVNTEGWWVTTTGHRYSGALGCGRGEGGGEDSPPQATVS